jgi:hypothetical protein
MRVIRTFVALSVMVILVASPVWSMQESESIVAHAVGKGVLKYGDEEFKVTSVIIKLYKDGKAEINLTSELIIFVSGTWSRDANTQKLNLKITSGATGGGVEAAGDLTLRGESRTVDRVSLKGESRTTHRKVSLTFQATD